MSVITKHGEQRFKERVGLSKKISEDVCNKALQDGLSHKDVSGSLCKFLDGLYLSYKKSNNTRIYNEKVFLFHDTVLITVLNLPNKFKKIVEKIKNKK